MDFGQHGPMAISLRKRSVGEELSQIPNTLSSWDACMAKSYCKWPVIAGCIVGGLILISVAWCCYRCCCRRRRNKRQTTFFNDPVPNYANGPNSNPHGPMGGGGYNHHAPPPPINIINTTAPSPQVNQAPAGPQYAYFDTGSKNNDDLPVMPSWNGAKSEKIEDTSTKVETIELDEVDNAKHQQHKPSSSTPPHGNHMPLGGDPTQYHNRHHNQGQNFPPSRMNTPFGPGGHGPPRLNTPYGGPNGLPNRVLTPPTRIQSPYPEGNSMPTAHVPPPSTNLPYGATSHDDFDYNPHINANNQGPYANADIFPPEPSYQRNDMSPQYTGTTAAVTAASLPQFTGTTPGSPAPPVSPQAPYQQTSYTGTTVADPYPPQPLNNTGGFVAQMDDDFGHPQPLPQNHNNSNNGPRQNGGFDFNEFDHGGYNNFNNNNNSNNHQAGAHGGYNQDQYHNTQTRPGMQQNNSGYDRPPQQGWSAF